MAVLPVTNPTLLDVANRTDPDGTIAEVIELLNARNEVTEDMTWLEGNLTDGHQTSVRTGIPTPTWRKMYGGVQPTKSTTATVKDTTGMLEAYAEIDKALADLNGNTAAFRLSENLPHIEGITQKFVDTLFNGNEATEPEAFTGFGPRYNDLSAENGDNIIDGGGTGSDNRSIWLVVWSPNTVHGIIPKGSTAGLQIRDLGEVTLEDASDGSNTGRMQAYRTHFRMDAGLSLRDWRSVVRIANIDKSNLTKDGSSSSADLPDLMFQAVNKIHNMGAGRAVFYMSRDVMSILNRQVTNATSGSTLQMENVGGKINTSWMQIPLRRVDTLASDEARVV